MPYERKSESIAALGDSNPVGADSLLQDIQDMLEAMMKIAMAAKIVGRTRLLLRCSWWLSNY